MTCPARTTAEVFGFSRAANGSALFTLKAKRNNRDGDGPPSGRCTSARGRRFHQLHVMRMIRHLTCFMLAAVSVLSDFSRAGSATPTMKAIVIHKYGGLEVLKYEDVPRPEPQPDQILVRVVASGVNPVDGLIRSGMFANGNRAFPIILGGDIAGVVEKVGKKITKFKAGDPVFAYVSLDN